MQVTEVDAVLASVRALDIRAALAADLPGFIVGTVRVQPASFYNSTAGVHSRPCRTSSKRYTPRHAAVSVHSCSAVEHGREITSLVSGLLPMIFFGHRQVLNLCIGCWLALLS